MSYTFGLNPKSLTDQHNTCLPPFSYPEHWQATENYVGWDNVFSSAHVFFYSPCKPWMSILTLSFCVRCRKSIIWPALDWTLLPAIVDNPFSNLLTICRSSQAKRFFNFGFELSMSLAVKVRQGLCTPLLDLVGSSCRMKFWEMAGRSLHFCPRIPLGQSIATCDIFTFRSNKSCELDWAINVYGRLRSRWVHWGSKNMPAIKISILSHASLPPSDRMYKYGQNRTPNLDLWIWLRSENEWSSSYFPWQSF